MSEKPCCINLYDIPGFGDVKGHDMDEKIHAMVSAILNKIEYLDYVFFVVKSPDQKLDHNLRYVYDTIQKLYAEDLSSKVCGIFTFSPLTEAPPKALKAIEAAGFKIPEERQFKFNNDIWKSEKSSNRITKSYW